jgi:5-methylcytosine-specific restriction endonuclease McrA
MRHRTAQVIEPVSLDVLYTRDQGICSLCHAPVSRADASIDHIIPVRKGGEHSYRNTALAHRRCNSGKRDRVVVQQLRLF